VRILLATVWLIIGAHPVLAQDVPTADSAQAEFDVASIKPNTSVQQFGVIRVLPGAINSTNAPLALLVRFAFDLPEARVLGLPDWAMRERFDVTAKSADPAASLPALRPMLQSLLRERFGLVAEHAKRELLVNVVERGARLGPRLRVSDTPCEAVASSDVGAAKCGMTFAFGHVGGRHVGIEDLVTALSALNRTLVVDRTGMLERFDLDLDYTPDAVADDPAVAAEYPAIDPRGPALGTAIREQLGLRWSTSRELADVLVVQRVQRPLAD